MKKILYASNNPGKYHEVSKLLTAHDIQLLQPSDLGLDLDPEETGTTLEENAAIKCQAFIDVLNDPNIVVIADDTGVEIDALDGEPGIHVRRWKGYRMTDQEIIEYTIERMEGVPTGKRGAQFRTVISVGTLNDSITTYDGILRGSIVEKITPYELQGFPFGSTFYIDEFKLMLGDVHNLSIEEKEAKGFHSHRERAVQSALPEIKRLLRD